MTTLHDRLAELADSAGTGTLTGPPEQDLWRRGRRYARRRRLRAASVVVAVALVAAVGAAGLSLESHRVEPAPPSGETVLPDRFFEPSGRLPVAHDGTGPLVAVIPAEHLSWRGSGEMGLVGVSAVDQQYAFLDLPDWIGTPVGDDSWSLSPNGRWIAYWYGDRPSDVTSSLHRARGIAVLETATGEVRRFRLGGDLGVRPATVAWTGDAAWFPEWEITAQDEDSSDATLAASWTWALSEDGPRRVSDPRGLVQTPMGPAGREGFLAPGREDRWFAVHGEGDLRGAPVTRFGSQGTYSPNAAALSPDERTVVVSQPDDQDSSARLLVGTVAKDETTLRDLDANVGTYPLLLGWLDDHTVTVVMYPHDERLLASVDVDTGATATLSTFEQQANNGTQFATDLLDSPVVVAKRPPSPHDPRWLALWVGLGALAVAWGGFAIRRRRAGR